MDWFERECANLERDLADGVISYEEFKKQMKDLSAELRDQAHEAAEHAYRDTMGYY